MESFSLPKPKPTFYKDMYVDVKLDMRLRAEVHFDFQSIISYVNGLLSSSDHNKAVEARHLVDDFIKAVETSVDARMFVDDIINDICESD